VSWEGEQGIRTKSAEMIFMNVAIRAVNLKMEENILMIVEPKTICNDTTN
jgi:hypothetical protein